MENNQEKNTRKLLLALPLLVLPFLSLGFYALGGGKGDSSGEALTAKPGINTSLPDAAFKKEDPQSKLSLYELAGREQKPDSLPASVTKRGFGTANLPDPNEQRINEKLAQINTEVNRPVPPVDYGTRYTQPANNNNMTGDVDRLEKLMRTMQEGKTEDPEMKQLSEMMDKIIAIQNPESVATKTVKPAGTEGDTKFKAIPAQIVDKQKAVQGATIKLRLQDTVTLYGYLIPKGHEIFGPCRITNQRLLLDIKNIRLGTSIIPVDLSVYSLDGMPGLYAPEAELADAAGNGADDAVRSIGMYGMDNSIATQVAGAGIDAAKSLFSKKIKKIKVKLESGQPVLLRNNQQKIR
ncbi:conjugative transposon protein TraM [Mucilaginibacter paludis]|uniref:Conjugative transposon TraM protein n=1 Tax=Mucilaginibacter paludis DSM 18603 TaxID=714943 RepID=H1YHF7_9SPHI|nr:conjugative transposon protein TraM [Mucilaginibacter paludis]EHQ25491.1 conjugative transposon TraM protein [Mucilaginibacter paludis DSM 18603]